MDDSCVRALMQDARVLLMSTTASLGRHFVQGLNALGVPLVSSRMLRAALRGVNPPGVMRLAAPLPRRQLRPFLHLGGWSIRLIMGQQSPDDPGIFVG